LPLKGPVDTAGAVVGSEPRVVDVAPVSVDVRPVGTEVVDPAPGADPPVAFTAFDDGTPHADPASRVPISPTATNPLRYLIVSPPCHPAQSYRRGPVGM
jgi:hypothetical protein